MNYERKIICSRYANRQSFRFSPRAIETLRNVDFIAAEDTRVTLKLLNKFEIKTPMISYHEHNMRERGEFVCERIETEKTVP